MLKLNRLAKDTYDIESVLSSMPDVDLVPTVLWSILQ